MRNNIRIPYLLDEDRENYASFIKKLEEDLINCIKVELDSIDVEIENKNLLTVEQLEEYNREKLTNLQQKLTVHIIKRV